MDFITSLQNTLVNGDSNVSVTENGAVGYKTTGKALLDMNFSVSSLRNVSDGEIINKFIGCCAENINAAIVWLFFSRDARGGLGERRLFRVCTKYLAREFTDKMRKVLPLISEYGRWDDLICLLDTKLKDDVVSIIKKQLMDDVKNMRNGESISLLAKWMPSENASSNETKKRAVELASAMHMAPRSYRIVLSALRRHIGIIESKMSKNEWQKITYSAVPSRANLIYNSAFLRHDEERRREYLGKLEKGEEKINSSVLFPHDIVHKYGGYYGNRNVDPALEAMWKALPNTVKNGKSTIVVADGSGSMTSRVGKTNVSCLDVANALAIYFAEKLEGPYKDKYITFSMTPQLVNLAGATTLRGKLDIAYRHNECTNTNIEAVFDLILETAVKNHLTQDELPANVLILSDMEFDACAVGNGGNKRVTSYGYSYFDRYNYCNKTMFKKIEKTYRDAGYHLPRLVFWNICSRTGTIPVKENDYGVALVSGFSPNVAKMVMSGKLDPMDALMETLDSPRYAPVWEALK